MEKTNNTCIEMDSKEILYIASMINAKQIMGIRDGFAGLSEQQMNIGLSEIRNSLMEKGYGTLNFDGEFSIKEDIGTLIAHCCFCEKYVAAKMQPRREIEIGYYWKNGRLIRIAVKGDTYQFSAVTNIDMCRELIELFGEEKGQNEIQGDDVYLDYMILEELRDESLSDGLKRKLQAAGCSGEIAYVLCTGLRAERDTFLFAVNDLTQGDTTSFVNIKMKNGILELSDVEVEHEEKIKVSVISHRQRCRKIKDVLSKVSLWEEEQLL